MQAAITSVLAVAAITRCYLRFPRTELPEPRFWTRISSFCFNLSVPFKGGPSSFRILIFQLPVKRCSSSLHYSENHWRFPHVPLTSLPLRPVPDASRLARSRPVSAPLDLPPSDHPSSRLRIH